MIKCCLFFFFFNDTATTEIYTLSLHDALPISTEPRPEFYVPFVVHPPQRAYLAVRTRTDPLTLASGVRNQVVAVDRDEAVSDLNTMEDVIDESIGQQRLTMLS